MVKFLLAFKLLGISAILFFPEINAEFFEWFHASLLGKLMLPATWQAQKVEHGGHKPEKAKGELVQESGRKNIEWNRLTADELKIVDYKPGMAPGRQAEENILLNTRKTSRQVESSMGDRIPRKYKALISLWEELGGNGKAEDIEALLNSRIDANLLAKMQSQDENDTGGENTDAKPTSEFIDCGDENDLLSLDTIAITPDPPRRGARLLVNVKGRLARTVSGGKVSYTVRFGRLPFVVDHAPLCEFLSEDPNLPKCPLDEGEIEYQIPADVPGTVPPGEYVVDIEAEDQKGDRIFCYRAKINMAF